MRITSLMLVNTKLFFEAFYYFPSRSQHHVRRLVRDPKTGQEKRMIPNTCACKANAKEWKHEASWTNRVSPKWMTQPLFMCKDLAKSFGLRTCKTCTFIGWDKYLVCKTKSGRMAACQEYAWHLLAATTMSS